MPLADRAGLWNLVIEAGATFSQRATPTGTPWDLTGYTGRAQARITYPDTDVAIDLTAGITLGDTDGWVQIDLTAEETTTLGDALGHVETSIVWDLELSDGGSPDEDVTRFAQGIITVSPEATREVGP